MAYRATPRTEARRAAVRARILDAAVTQLADGGYAGATVQAVAGRAQVATGTVYRHFPSKAELFAEVFRRASQRELDVLEQLLAGSGSRPAAERIAAAAEAFARRALAEPARAYALIAEPVDPGVEAERLAFRRGYRDVFAAALEDGVAAGELEPHDTRTLAAALVGALGEVLVGPLAAGSDRRARSHEPLVASIVSFCVNALPSQTGRALAA